jgi:LPS-assembly lipoprotein
MSVSRLAGRVVMLGLCLGLGLGLAACGFQPLYGTHQAGAPVSHELASVAVVEQTTRLGQLIRNELVSTLSTPGQQAPARYTLELRPRAAEEVTIQGFDTGVLRRSFRVDVDFRLLDADLASEVYAGRTFSQASYDRTGTPFANRQARIAAEERAAKEVGSDIATRLAAYFASR